MHHNNRELQPQTNAKPVLSPILIHNHKKAPVTRLAALLVWDFYGKR